MTLLIPPGAMLLGVLVLGERAEPRQIAGMALIGAGLAAIDGRVPAALRRRALRARLAAAADYDGSPRSRATNRSSQWIV